MKSFLKQSNYISDQNISFNFSTTLIHHDSPRSVGPHTKSWHHVLSLYPRITTGKPLEVFVVFFNHARSVIPYKIFFNTIPQNKTHKKREINERYQKIRAIRVVVVVLNQVRMK